MILLAINIYATQIISKITHYKIIAAIKKDLSNFLISS